MEIVLLLLFLVGSSTITCSINQEKMDDIFQEKSLRLFIFLMIGNQFGYRNENSTGWQLGRYVVRRMMVDKKDAWEYNLEVRLEGVDTFRKHDLI